MAEKEKLNIENEPLISIVTVVFNGEKHLEQTILSVINQSYKNIEYIIIDGASTDRTPQIIKKYKSKINYSVSEPDKGIYDAMNKGIKQAKGEYIGILNSDDFYEPDAVRIIAEHIKQHSETDVFFGNLYIINPELPDKQLQTYKKSKKFEKQFSIWHPTVFIKKQTYDTFGIFDTSYKIAADYELLLRFYKKGCRFFYINEAITNFREGGVSYYNKNINRERFRLQLAHTNIFNAYANRIIFSLKELLQKLFKFILKEKYYHKLRYKFLYK